MNEFLESRNNKINRIIVFAGVFDPVHKGHLSAAEAALHYGSKVIFLPEYVPQHKHGSVPYEHRLEMLKLATKNNTNFEVVDYPNERQYIEETFSWLAKMYPNRKFVWLVGNDVVPMIKTWVGSEHLAKYKVDMVAVIKREGLDTVRVTKVHDTPVVHLNRPRRKHEHLRSSVVRSDLRHSHTALPDGVWNYIKQHNLYC